MPDTASTATDFLARVFGPVTEHAAYVCSLPNERDIPGQPGEKWLMSRDMGEIASFATKWDRRDRGLFFCVGTIRPDATPSEKGSYRTKDNVGELHLLHADIDAKDITIGLDEASARLMRLPRPPSIVVRSGNGLHAYWLLKESFRQTERADVEAMLRQLADLVGGDLAVAEISRLMRLPGSHNSKGGAWNEVVLSHADYGRRYDLVEIEDMLAELSPVIERKAQPSRPRGLPDNPFLAVAARLGFRPPVDVQQRLAAMSFKGTGDGAIHATQLSVTASMLTRGQPLDEVIGIVLEATRAAAGEFGERWNWRREERAVRDMCEAWLRKNPTVRALPRREEPAVTAETKDDSAAGEAANGTTGAVVPIAAARERRGRRKVSTGDPSDIPVIVADGVIEAIRGAGQDILLTEGEVFLYADGVWHVMTPADQQWMQTLVQEGFEALGKPAKTAALGAAWKRIVEHPSLFRRAVTWNVAGRIVAQNGVLDLGSGSFGPHDKAFHSRRKIGAAYDQAARCPLFTRFMDTLFADQQPDERDRLIGLVQAFTGASLAITMLSREERRALVLHGPSRTGKTELARIIRLLVGSPVATPSVAEISERFGLASLYEASAWIRDDAINEGDDLDPQRFKTVVTGEPIDIERKHRDAVRAYEFAIPVLLTTNAMPRTRDRSDAIFNRSLVIDMANVFSEEDALAMRAALGVPRGQSVAGHIFEQEGPGILNWALQGFRSLVARGSYDIPDSVRASIQRFKDDNNPVGEWGRVALIRRHGIKVARHDVLCAYHGWQKEQDGDEARALGGRAFWPRFRSVAPYSDPDSCDVRGRRWVVGVALTDEGLHLWERHNDAPLKSGCKGASATRSEVNKLNMEEAHEAAKTHF